MLGQRSSIEQHQSQSMFTRIRVCVLLALISAPGLSGADFAMNVTDKNYLDTQGFSVFLYDSTYHPVFVDQKNTALEMIFHGQRIATNGDVRLYQRPSNGIWWQPSKGATPIRPTTGSPPTSLSRPLV
jgi:hypothetical protein